jgi:hypothetical protein
MKTAFFRDRSSNAFKSRRIKKATGQDSLARMTEN